MSKGPEAAGNLGTVRNGKAGNAGAGGTLGVGVPSTKLKPGTEECSVRVMELVSEDYVKV